MKSLLRVFYSRKKESFTGSSNNLYGKGIENYREPECASEFGNDGSLFAIGRTISSDPIELSAGY